MYNKQVCILTSVIEDNYIYSGVKKEGEEKVELNTSVALLCLYLIEKLAHLIRRF